MARCRARGVSRPGIARFAFARYSPSMTRAVSLPALAAVTATFFASWFGPQTTSVDAPCIEMRISAQGGNDPNAAATCGLCHTQIHREWKERGHSNAWDNEHYQEELEPKKRPQSCYGCHIPRSVHDRLGRKPKTRKVNRHEGVTCVTCHRQGDGDAVLGPHGASTDAHPTEKHPAFTLEGSNAMCLSCHSTKIAPVLPVGKDFKANIEALKAKEVVSCTQCHMPEVERHSAIAIATGKPVGEKRKMRSHRMLGPYDVEFVAAGFGVEIARGGDQVLVNVENKAGHRMPGSRERKFVVLVEQLDRAGKSLQKDRVSFEDKNELRTLETRELRFSAAAGVVDVKVSIDHEHHDKVVATIKTETKRL